MTSTSADTVAAIYAAFGRGDLPYLAARRGRQEVSGFFAALAEHWTIEEFRVLDVIGSGRQVAAEIETALSRPDGTRLVDDEMHLWTFDDAGRVVRFRHYCDTARHVAAYRGEDTVTSARPSGTASS